MAALARRPVTPAPEIVMTADAIIRRLELRPHPEGGHYRETFRDPRLSP